MKPHLLLILLITAALLASCDRPAPAPPREVASESPTPDSARAAALTYIEAVQRHNLLRLDHLTANTAFPEHDGVALDEKAIPLPAKAIEDLVAARNALVAQSETHGDKSAARYLLAIDLYDEDLIRAANKLVREQKAGLPNGPSRDPWFNLLHQKPDTILADYAR